MQSINFNLLDKVDEIEAAWFQVFGDSSDFQLATEQIHQCLHDLFCLIASRISTGQIQAEDTHAIGRELALLGIPRVDALASLHTILCHYFSPGIDPSQVERVFTSLGNIFTEVIAGFITQHHIEISLDHEHAQRFEEELRASEARYRNVVEDQTEIIVRWTPDNTVTFVNTAGCSFIGLRYDLLVGHPFRDFFTPADNSEIGKFISNLYSLTPENSIAQGQTRFFSLKDEVRWLQWRTRAIFDDNRQIIEFQTVASDITEIKRIQDELRESEARYRSVIEGQSELIIRYLPDATITFVNDADCRFFSLTREELLGHSVLNLIYQGDRADSLSGFSKLASLTPKEPFMAGEIRVNLPNGKFRWIQWTTRALFNEDGHINEYQSVGSDITELKLAQEKLEQQNELLRQLSEQMINVQEIERQRIALELHDSILNELGAILIGPPENITPKNIRGNYERLIEQLRQTINDLRSPMLNYGLYAALEDLCDNLTDNPRVENILIMDIQPSQSRFDSNTELHLFRIIQQACDNALRHAQASQIHIHGQINDSWVDITVEDDGIGFQPRSEIDMAQVTAKKHYGLVSMLERAKLIGANVKLFSNPGAGTQVRVLWEANHN